MLTNRNLEAIAPVLATFTIKQTDGVDELKDANLGDPVKLTGNFEIGCIDDGKQLLGKLISLSLCDDRDGERLATVQIGGICRLAISMPYPQIGNGVVGGATQGTVRRADSMFHNNITRGIVMCVDGTIDCMVLLN